MSLPSKQTVKCPKCGAEIEFTLWNSINTEMSFAIPDIISGKLFEIECKKCGFKNHVVYPILFNDMQHKVWIWLTLDQNNEEYNKSLEFAKLMQNRIRIVTTQEELREKTLIFNAELDDRVVEVAKLICEEQLTNQLNGEKIEKMFLNINDNEYRWELIINGKQAFVGTKRETLNKLETQIADRLPSYEDEPFIIDRDWAFGFLESY